MIEIGEKMKKSFILVTLSLVVAIFVGCSNNEKSHDVEADGKLVKMVTEKESDESIENEDDDFIETCDFNVI